MINRFCMLMSGELNMSIVFYNNKREEVRGFKKKIVIRIYIATICRGDKCMHKYMCILDFI